MNAPHTLLEASPSQPRQSYGRSTAIVTVWAAELAIIDGHVVARPAHATMSGARTERCKPNETASPRRSRVVWPDRDDPRLRLSAVVITLQVLGQTVLGFKVSVAQILVTVAACAVVDAAIVYARTRKASWPASAILTGNSTALLLRTTGTHHGDWWSLNGVQFFLFAALLGLLSKYVIRVGGRHVYNPSNLGLVVAFLVLGAGRVFPQYLWWGPIWPWVLVAWVVIVAGGIWVLWPLRMWPMVLGFTIPFAALMGVQAATGRCFDAVWRTSAVCGSNYWLGIAGSPELFVFVLLMMSDPRTTPATPRRRALFGAATAVVAALLIQLQPAEYGVKVALLSSLAVACTCVPLARAFRRLSAQRLAPALAAVLITASLTIGVVSLSGSRQTLAVDRHPATSGGGSVQ